MKKVILLLFLASLVLSGSCTKQKSKPTDYPEDRIFVGFSMGTLMEDRWIRDRDIFLSMAKQNGMEVTVKNANKDSDLQYRQVMEMIHQGIDVLILAPNDCNSEVKCVKAAKDRGIPVISYDRLVRNADVDLYVSFDHFKVGKVMAEELLKKAPDGGYLIVNGPESDDNTRRIQEGAMSVLKEPMESGRVRILGKTWAEGWTRENAYRFASEQIRKSGRDIRAILCGNDSLAWGAIDALAEAQMIEQVAVSGQDADLVACQRIVNGEQTMTTYKPIQKLVEKTVESCLRLAAGQKVPGQGTMSDGTYEIPCILIDVLPVTKENMKETVIRDGFHLYEDIYQTKK